MKNYILSTLKLTFVMLIIVTFYLCIVYAGSKVLPMRGNAEIINYKGQKFYANIGQNFASLKYFHGRPSAVDYNAASSGGSNKGPGNKEYLQTVQKRINTLKRQNPDMENVKIPVELVTASGSGLDPDISPEGAIYQVKRISKVRDIPAEKLKDLIESQTRTSFFGPSKVNVLKLNIALNELK